MQAAAKETQEQATIRHDAHLLHLLENFSRGIEDLDIRYTLENDKFRGNSLRFHALVPDAIDAPYSKGKNNCLQIGVAPLTYSLPFNQGSPVVTFFCFYSHRTNLGAEGLLHHQDCLFNSAIYSYQLPLWGSRSSLRCLKPWKGTRLQRTVKVFNDLCRRLGGGKQHGDRIEQFRAHGDPKHNFRIDQALQEAVFKAIAHLDKQDDARKYIGICLKS